MYGVATLTPPIPESESQSAQNSIRTLSDEYLAAIVESSDDAIIGKTLDGIVVSWNRSAEKMFGYSAAEMIGQSIARLMPPDRPDDFRQLLDRIRRGERVEHYETVRLRKDGQLVSVSLSVSPIRNKEGIIVGASKIARDIGERKRAEAALHATEQALSAVFEASPAGLVLIDPATRCFERVNAAYCRITGFSTEELLRLTAADVTHPEDRAEDERKKAPLLRGEVPSYFTEKRYLRKDGSVIWVQVVATTVSTANGQKRHMSVILDITDRKNAEDEAQRAKASLEGRVEARTRELAELNRELEAFAYSVSHDLRTPLRSIDGFGERLISRYPGRVLDSTGVDYLRRMTRASRRMGQLIDDLLALSRTARGQLNLDTVNLSAIAEEITNESRSQDPARSVLVSIEPDMTDRADPRLIKILLENLLGNAWKYTSKTEASALTFGRDATEDGWVYFIRDNGAGFDMAYAGRLFSPFQRLHRTDEFEGTGIGLATAQRIVQRHGGRIWARAEKAKGATFYFTLLPSDRKDV
ncbi:MAG: PAS domain S-box protein [Acidobacteriaceae bacterium]|nr:PAS domain S-box protein [Acidobacteriaceae bacterium]